MDWNVLESCSTFLAAIIALFLGLRGIYENTKHRKEQLSVAKEMRRLALLEVVFEWANEINQTSILYSREAIHNNNQTQFSAKESDLSKRLSFHYSRSKHIEIISKVLNEGISDNVLAVNVVLKNALNCLNKYYNDKIFDDLLFPLSNELFKLNQSSLDLIKVISEEQVFEDVIKK